MALVQLIGTEDNQQPAYPLYGGWPCCNGLAADVVQKIQDWLKESGQLTDHSLAAFQRNPAGPK